MSEPRSIQVISAPAPTQNVRREPLLRWVLGDILRQIRLRQRRTLKDVAQDAQVSMPYLSEVERGLKEASSEVLAAICQALDLTVSDLLGLAQGELSAVRESRSLVSRTERATATLSQPGDLGAGPSYEVSLYAA